MHSSISKEDMFIIAPQKVVVSDFECSGVVLDIGGGGEGIIGLLKGEKVIAIDKKKEELEEAPQGPLKIVMDATNLQILDNSFNTITAFFTLMYIPRYERKKVFEEAYRVLAPGGQMLIWDVVIPPRGETVKEWIVVPVQIAVQGRKIDTGYGVKWEGREQNVIYYETLASSTRFTVAERKVHDQSFFLKLQKEENQLP